MEKICKNCIYWKDGEYNKLAQLKSTRINFCTMTEQFWDTTEWNRNSDDDYYTPRVLKEEFKNQKAFTQDGSDYMADLITTEDFGCNQWQS